MDKTLPTKSSVCSGESFCETERSVRRRKREKRSKETKQRPFAARNTCRAKAKAPSQGGVTRGRRQGTGRPIVATRCPPNKIGAGLEGCRGMGDTLTVWLLEGRCRYSRPGHYARTQGLEIKVCRIGYKGYPR